MTKGYAKLEMPLKINECSIYLTYEALVWNTLLGQLLVYVSGQSMYTIVCKPLLHQKS